MKVYTVIKDLGVVGVVVVVVVGFVVGFAVDFVVCEVYDE